MMTEVLLLGSVDWMQVGEIGWLAEEFGGNAADEAVMETALATIETLLTDGLAEIGDVVRDRATGTLVFVPWDVPAAEAVARVRRGWLALGRQPYLRELGSLQLTPAGEQRAAAIAQARRAETGADGGAEDLTTPAARELLLAGLDDELAMAYSAQAVERGTGLTSDSDLREATLTALGTLLAHGLAKIGDYEPDPTGRTIRSGTSVRPAQVYVPWALSVDKVVARLRREWIALGRPPNPWESAWLAQTPKGRRTAKALQPDRPRGE